MSKKKNILLKIDTEIAASFKKQANKYTGGNVAKWLRFAGSKLKPTNSEQRRALSSK